ncbi:hypothetical protein BKA82DRAFT_4016865 [Pisolithus tinctorius]|uniref:Uncharacterized protein n=1 Tax=Pisolithus tinctorius Marx 270 TaxID=870435 RepID=A0A0C3NSD0_PISTI|nr:hypothetical protein BKA82DRAFT_4016865 [Pisolithus tinctorius]KIO03750.1 hypothetical protein M404DRAFT_9412 [Pisolithus tinctorius Marx 270]
MLLEINCLTEQGKLPQIPTIWYLQQSVLDLSQGFGPHAKSQAPWGLYWDGMTSQPILSPTNPLLALMPKEYTGESLGTAVEWAAIKKTIHLQEPTADLTHTAPFPMVQELLGTAGFGSIFQTLQYLNPLRLKNSGKDT